MVTMVELNEMMTLERFKNFFDNKIDEKITRQVTLLKLNGTKFLIFGREDQVKQAKSQIDEFYQNLLKEKDNCSAIKQTIHFKDAPNPLYAQKLTLTQKFIMQNGITSFNCTDSKVEFEAPKGKCKEIM